MLTGPSAGQFVDLAGSQAFGGYRPADALNAGRTRVGGYVDLATKRTRQWDVDVAGREVHYSDFGNNASGKVATRYELSREVAVHGAISNGFRAPSLGQQYYSAGATAQFRGVDYTIANLPVESSAARLTSAQPLKPEKSPNLSVGLVLRPLDRLGDHRRLLDQADGQHDAVLRPAGRDPARRGRRLPPYDFAIAGEVTALPFAAHRGRCRNHEKRKTT